MVAGLVEARSRPAVPARAAAALTWTMKGQMH